MARHLVAGLALLGALGVATPSAAQPTVSPDRLDDALAEGDTFASMGDFAWRAFIALNWPSVGGERAAPDRAKTLGDSGPRAWETFKSAAETFPFDKNGGRKAPSAWGSYGGPNPCGGDNAEKTIAAFRPFAEFNQPSFALHSPSNPLVAENGEYVRYEVRFNEAEFSTFLKNGWSEGRSLPDAEHPAYFPVGSLEVKAAWRPLNPADAPAVRARYFVTRAAFVDVAKSLAEGHIACSTRDVALVGMHVVIKTKTKAQWIWSTFEHVDNVPPASEGEAREPDAKDAGAPYGFFDASRVAKLWPPFGAADTLPVDWDNPPKHKPTAMQVVRRHPINAAFMATNRAYWALPGVKGTVFEHYMLVASQWPTNADPPGPQNDGAYFPGSADANRVVGESYRATAAVQENLINTTMETYLQEAPSSCMACHQSVSNVHGNDFVGLLAGMK
jgi:hypothetical protein